jgi:hypothetical protein
LSARARGQFWPCTQSSRSALERASKIPRSRRLIA